MWIKSYNKKWLKEKYEDLIITIKIFAKFFNIKPINSKVVKYIIAQIYLTKCFNLSKLSKIYT